MNQKFVFSGIVPERAEEIPEIKKPFYEGENFQVSQDEYILHVEGFGKFYAGFGGIIKYYCLSGADPGWVNIYLQGQVLAAIFHQRNIINFHASSLIYKNHGIMILGETGAGKSSLTAAFTLENGGFLSDDFTPLFFENGLPLIWPVYKTIKIRENTVSELGIKRSLISKAEEGTGKYFLEVAIEEKEKYPLHIVLKLEIGKNPSVKFSIPEPSEKFALLRSEICSWEMLKGMPDTEKAYLGQLVDIVSNVEIIRVVRPELIAIKKLYIAIRKYLEDNFLTNRK